MTCATCGTENEPGRKFCGECGARLTVSCPACNTPNAPGTKFCGECGTLLAGADQARNGDQPARAHEPVAERRLVSVLFADLVGFTTLSESRDAEEVRELLTRYFDTCRELVTRYGGVIEKFIGDAVMAVWGAPTTNEDDAERAVRAALDLTAAVAALGEGVGLPTLRARAGVLSGEAAVTLGAKGQGMVAGDLVNTASRIQSAAQPGTVLVGSETKHATESAIEYEPAGVQDLKGKAEPIELWRAVRVVGLVGGAVRAREIEPPFTGRDPELRLIKQLFHASADEKRAHLVSVLGIGGIGKSRLAWEFEKYVDGLAMEVWWQRGRCLAYGDGVAFWALAEMVRGRAGIVEDEASESAIEKLRASLDEHVPDPEERRFVEPRLSQLLGLEARATGDQENLFSAWRIYFERLADTMPTILVFEDLHWADSSLLDFIEYLLEWSRDRPIFTLTLARPELTERRLTWGAAKRGFTSLFLEPLPRADVEALLEGAVTGLPADLRSQILDRAEGIPFYAVETVRMLLDRGLLVREGSAYRPTGPIETLEVPTTLHALIAARLDGLEPEERRVLQDASVLGRTFTQPGLLALTGMTDDELAPILAALVRKEILSITTDPLSPERGQYGFLQELVKRVAYETMSKRDRRPRHLAAAAYLASITGDDDDIVEVVAAHYLDAYNAAPDASDAHQIREQARDAQVRAGERVASLGANLSAQRYFERAAELTEDPIVQAELLERAGMMAAAGTRAEYAAELYSRAVRLFEQAGATHAAAGVSARHAEIMWDLGRLRDGVEAMDRSFKVLAEEPPDANLAWLAAQIGRFKYFAGEEEVAAERLETALQIAEALGLPEVLSQALNTKGLLLSTRGRRKEGMALLRYSLDVALEHDKPSAALRAYNNLADTAHQDDQYAGAQRYVDDGVSLARRVGNRYWELVLLGQLYPPYALGDWDGALARRGELGVLGEDSQVRTAYTQGFVAFGVAIHVNRGDLAAAAELLEAYGALETSADVQEQGEYAAARTLLLAAQGDAPGTLEAARAALAQRGHLGLDDARIKEVLVVGVDAALTAGDRSAAESLLRIANERTQGHMTHFGLAHSMRFQARMADGSQDPARIEDAWKGAIGLFREMALPFWTAVTLLEQAEWLMSEDRTDDASPIRDEARTIFESLGARPWIERANSIGVVATAT
jgi:class 3 adenylate cyclase/tetratricopeptide (TPR) repeat protein